MATDTAAARTDRATGGSLGGLLRAYLGELRAYPLLTREDEARLAEAIEDGRHAAAELTRGQASPARRRLLEDRVEEGRRATRQFVQANLRLVVSIAKRYQSPSVSLLDLIQEGNLGLIHAVSRFDYRRGFKFSTYARYWVHQSIVKAVAEHAQPVRIPVQVMDAAWRARRTQARLEVERGYSPQLEELACEMQLTTKQVADLLGFLNEPRSLSERTGEDGEELGATVVDAHAPAPDDEAVGALLPFAVARLLAGLDEREAEIIRLHYGLGGSEPRTLSEIGARYALTRERVRQIEKKALEKLRNPTSRDAHVALALAGG